MLLSASLAGCWHAPDPVEPPTPTTSTPVTPTDGAQPRLTFGGVVLDARTLEPIPAAQVRLDLAQTQPCRRPGIIWNAYPLEVNESGRFGPLTLPTPRSDDVAFFLQAEAAGYSRNVTFIGPDEARRGTRDLTVVLHPEASFTGSAPPGTVIALDAPFWPRLAVADAEGKFAFPNARAVPTAFVVATEPPLANVTEPPSLVQTAGGDGATWRLEGVVKAPNGANVAADVVAREDGRLVSAARSGTNGVFVLPLEGRRQDLTVEARTPEGALGGALRVLVEGPPALRQSVLLRALC